MKFYGVVGYCESVEGTGDHEGIFEDTVTERNYYGDVVQDSKRWDSRDSSALDSLNASASINVLADAYMIEHLAYMKYVCWMGTRWKIISFKPGRPRIMLNLGGVYNGPTPTNTQAP